MRTGPFNNSAPATAVTLDYVQLLLNALGARGLQYKVIVSTNAFDAELPSALGFGVEHTDREVILARTDLNISDLKLSNPQAGSFTNNCTIPGGLIGPIVIRRGWVAVDAKIWGKEFRFISTHLDAECVAASSAIQEAQANENFRGTSNNQLTAHIARRLQLPR